MRKLVVILLSLFVMSWCVGDVFAKKPDNTGTTRKYNCKKDNAVDVPAGIFTIQVVAPFAIRIVPELGTDAGGYVLPQYYTFTSESGVVTHYSLFTDRLDPDFYVNGSLIENFAPGELYTVTLLSTDRCGNVGFSPTRSFIMPPVWDDSTPPIIKDISVTYTYFTNYHAVITVVEDPSGISLIEYYFNTVKLYSKLVNTDLDTYDGNNEFRFVLADIMDLAGQTGTLTVRVTDNAGNVTTRHLEVML